MDPTELTELENKFFETGELPEELQQPAQVETQEQPQEPVQEAEVESESHKPQDNPLDDLRRHLELERARNRDLEARIEKIVQHFSQPPKPQEKLPDPEQDPLGHTVAQIRALQDQVKTLSDRFQQGTEAQTQAQQLQAFVGHVKTLKDEFVKQAPDYYDAYNFVKDIRVQDLKDLGLQQDQINQILMKEELNISQTALQQGRNPAEVIYNVAKRYGYKAKAQTPPAEPANKIETIKKGLEASKGVKGSGVKNQVSHMNLKEMGEEDLDKVIEDDALWNKIVGGVHQSGIH